MRVPNYRFESLIFESIKLGYKKDRNVMDVSMIYKYAGHLQEFEDYMKDVNISETKIRNGMGRVTQFARDQGYMMIPVRFPTAGDADKLRHKIEGWAIITEPDDDRFLREIAFSKKIRNGHNDGIEKLVSDGVKTKVLKNPDKLLGE